MKTIAETDGLRIDATTGAVLRELTVAASTPEKPSVQVRVPPRDTGVLLNLYARRESPGAPRTGR